MRQRVMIALALSCSPARPHRRRTDHGFGRDCPVADPALITRLKRRRRCRSSLVTHDMGVVAEIADRVQVMYGGRVVEEGTAEDIFNDARHPYTLGLLHSIPRLDRPRPARLPAIGGVPASAGTIAPGCVFAERCAHRFEPCGIQPPLLAIDTTAHRAACHLEARTAGKATPAMSDPATYVADPSPVLLARTA